MTILSSLFLYGKTKALQNGEMAVFVPPTSKSTCMHRRSTLVRVTPCLPAMDAQLLTILDFQDAVSSGVDYFAVVNNSRIE